MRPLTKSTFGSLAAAFCLLAMFLAACGPNTTPPGSSQPAKAPATQQNFRYPLLTADISTFDPGQVTDLLSGAAIEMVFTGLVQMNDKLEVQPQLAHDYSSSADGLTWTFHLKPNLQFSDGTPLTSHDVIYSIDRALSPAIYALTGISLTYLGLIKDSDKRVNGKIASLINDSLLAPDNNTVVIQVSKQTAYFLQALTYPTSYVVEKKVIDQWGLKWTDHLADNGGQGGAGPFKVAEYNHTTGITFVPNPTYYGSHPQLQKVTFPFIKDENSEYQIYQAGQLDETSVPSIHLAQDSKLTKEFHKVPQLWVNYYGLNYLVKPFDNIKIRQAFDLAINKDIITQSIWHNQYIPTNHIVPSGMPGYDVNLNGPDGTKNTSGNTTMAKQLFAEGLQEEGLTPATFPSIKFTYSNKVQDTANEVNTVIQMWQQVLGVTIHPDPVEPATLFSEISATTGKATLQLWRVDWIADYPDPEDWMTLQFDKGFADNNVNYGQNSSSDASQQQQIQQALEQADGTTNQTTRMQMYNQAEQQLINDVAWLPMEQVTTTYRLKPYVVGVVDNSLDITPPDDWGNIYIATH